jgi:hypothetical protein
MGSLQLAALFVFPRLSTRSQWSVVSGQWSVVSGQWSVKMMADFDVSQVLLKSLWTFLTGQSRLIAGN